MGQITRDSLLTLEAYAKARPQMRAQTIEHKKNRRVQLGERMALMFEDELTLRYQIQEMLRAEKTFLEDAIQDELNAYTPLIPDGNNWKATMLIEYPNVEERRLMLSRLKGVEKKVYIQVAGHERVYAIADEDMERENEEKTSSVHFLRFDLQPAMSGSLKSGATLIMGVDHPAYTVCVDSIAEATRASLIADLAN